MEVIHKKEILKELKVDFEILNEKKMPGRELECEEFDVNIFLGTKDAIVGIAPTIDGSSEFFELDTPENVDKKIEEMQKAAEAKAAETDEIEDNMEL